MTLYDDLTPSRTYDGPPIVLLHGVGCNHAIWGDVMALLSETHEVHSIDLPGTGTSTAAAQPLTVPGMADAVRAHLEAQALDDVVLVGHSLGGMVAQELVCTDAAGIRALIACNTISAADTYIRKLNEKLAAMAERDGALALAMVLTPSLPGRTPTVAAETLPSRITDQFVLSGAELLAAQLRAVCSFDVTDRLHDLDVPTLVITGTDDAGIDAARVLAELAPGATWCELGGVGHMAPMEAPTDFASALACFLEDLEIHS